MRCTMGNIISYCTQMFLDLVTKLAELWKYSCFYSAHIFIKMKKPAATICDTKANASANNRAQL
jgi:hypothetical protein